MLFEFDFVFFHIPKCGGSSIREYFKNLFTKLGYKDKIYVACESKGLKNLMNIEILEEMNDIIKNKKILLSHINCKLYSKFLMKYCITCIRNPINRYISSFNHFILMDNKNKNIIKLFRENKLKPGTIYDKNIWFRKDLNDYNYIIIFENMKNDIENIKNTINKNINIEFPYVDPAFKSKKYKNYFKFNFKLSEHVDLYKFLKKELKNDIEIYNTIYINRNLNNLIIN